MFTKILAASAVLAAITLGAAGSAHAQSYKLIMPLPEDSDTVLRDITITPKGTTVTIVVGNTTDEIGEACIHPNHRPEAFTIKDLDSGRVLRQRGVTGIRSCARGMDTIRPGKRKIVKVQFEALPATARRLQVGENNCKQKEDDDMHYYCFAEVVLKSPK
ncbi:hypothetical protein [Acidovorax sp. Root217]|uniref:hypothetical protein n=1 Tax=Acidovorax sp. Root217 TaxID=1736492 RepID=UPI00070FB51C|nr:hypothetical protein [Acidovorax sp. Root217]KRC17554.1 hypothetical protein ASE31_29205 [Acidovorax sp. Root217]